MGVSYYYPYGVPKETQRIIDPDVIHRRVISGLGNLQKEWSALAKRADQVLKGSRPWWKRLFGKSVPVAAGHVLDRLYDRPSEWPRVLTKQEKDALLFLRRLRQMGHAPLTFAKGPAPDEAKMEDAFEMIAKDAMVLAKEAEAAFTRVTEQVGKEIEPLCESVYGEPCAGEGAEIVLADILDVVKLDRMPESMTDSGFETLKAYMKVVYGG